MRKVRLPCVRARFICYISVLAYLLISCHVTKFVPDGERLLYKTKIRLDDNSVLKESDLLPYLRQRQNTEILGFWKLQLHIYNTAPLDTTTRSKKRLARNAFKMGEAPEIYDSVLTKTSMEQLQKTMQNYGYFNARVDTSIRIKKNKVWLTYNISTGLPYHIRRYESNFEQPDIDRHANSRERLIRKRMQFNASVLDEERNRISEAMRKDGYYYFDKSFLDYQADSGLNNHEVDVKIKIADNLLALSDSLQRRVFRKCTISNIRFYQNYNPYTQNQDLSDITSIKNKGYEFSYTGKPFLRRPMLKHLVTFKPGMQYDALSAERTLARFNRLGAIKFTDLSFTPLAADSLDCRIVLHKSKLNTVSAEIEGTYTANDWGIAAGLGYANKNIFGGAEVLSLSGKGSYEWRQGGGRAIGIQGNAGLLFPTNFKLDFLYDYQNRPNEYERNIANVGLTYTFQRMRSHWIHSFKLIEISYVYLPWISTNFRDNILSKSSTLKHAYENHFIVALGYSGSFSTQKSYLPYRNYVRLHYNIEVAGNLLYGLSRSFNWSRDSLGSYLVGHVPFSQYIKADVDVSYHQYMHPKHQLVYHVGLGVAVPYVNSKSIPFERRYFSGGSRIRGWQARRLGPGIFPGTGESDLNTGDIRFDINIEYRWNFWNKLELALFTDAGNIWTFRDYEEQPGGVFKWKEFYKQLAWGYGFGFRYNFNIIVFTVDLGIKLHDPARITTDGKQWRTAANGLNFKDDFYFNFGIGYPF